MRLTLITETYFPQVNGVSRTLGQLVRVLENAGDTVQLIHPDYGQPLRKSHDLAMRSVNPRFYRELHVPIPPFRRMREAVDRYQPDIVHIATEATLGLAALRFAQRRGYPVVSSFHTRFEQYAEHYRVSWLQGTVWRYLRWFHNHTLETYVPSMATIRELELKGFRNLVLWPRGVDCAFFRPDRPGRNRVRSELGFAPDEIVIGHVSRIASEKNVLYLADALKLVVALRPAVRLLIVGDGPARGEVERILGRDARLVGYKAGDDLADHYAAMDLFAFSSLTETFGNVITEAMASGLPVVAVRAGGPADTVRPGETGFLVEPGAPPRSFADALLRLIDYPETRHRLSSQARAYAESQTWESIMSALRDRYLAILGDYPTPRLRVRSSL